MAQRTLRISVDRGGTFCDVFATDGHGRSWTHKLLSVSAHYPDATVEAVRRAVKHFYPQTQNGVLVDTVRVRTLRLGTTVATNALLERRGAPCALAITAGFADLARIGTQARPNLFDLTVARPDVLYDAVVEVDERVTLDPDGPLRGASGEPLKVLRAPDLERVKHDLLSMHKRTGIQSLAVCTLHSYTFPDHEHAIAQAACELGVFTTVTCSADLMPRIRAVARGMTAVTDAYLAPKIDAYLHSLRQGFTTLEGVDVELMQSDGGLVPIDAFRGYASLLSGPAGGVVGYALTSYASKSKRIPVIGLDMGGTSTDVSRYDGSLDHVLETETAGVTITTPQLDIHTVAAGGSSRLFVRSGILAVGPESAGSDPGPVCYRKQGGQLAITDANAVLGRISVRHFPRIFGPNQDLPLDVDGARDTFAQVAQGSNMTPEQLAMGFIQVANHTMANKVLAVTQAKGYDVQHHTLACFGGAAAQHAVELARDLGIHRVFIHRQASILSAYGLSLASVVHERQAPFHAVLTDALVTELRGTLARDLTEQVRTQFPPSAQIDAQIWFNLRYQGTDTAFMVSLQPNAAAMAADLRAMYVREFGFALEHRDVVVDDVRVRGTAKQDSHDAAAGIVTGDDLEAELDTLERENSPSTAIAGTQRVYFGQWVETPLYLLDRLRPGHCVQGPAIVLDAHTTLVLPPGSDALVTRSTLVVRPDTGRPPLQALNPGVCDPIQLSLFSHRFMHIAEQMGRTLQKCSVSTNIKERLDFSCALFAPDGALVANAPHIPVHLGAMQAAVREQLRLQPNMRDGDVFLANHPAHGGSHLPDMTVITPVFDQNGQLVFFVASRGHHADIGGCAPGSMPPDSKELYQEGAAIASLQLVREGMFQMDDLVKALVHEPAQYPGCQGTRNLADNVTDLKAQVAANHRGIVLCRELIAQYGLEVVHAYMRYIRDTAERAVREFLRSQPRRVLEAEDHMDDGTPIRVRIEINNEGSAVIDFAGTGPEVYGNTNAPPAVTHSAVIYVLRCLVAHDIPLNQGCLSPVDIRIPEGTLLRPSSQAAVVGGNVTTSQRVVDVVLRAFGACAASQGCCNNLTFGVASTSDKEGWGYYETIAGGAGAGPEWHGTSGVHTHMTNTRITDPEILERRYPVIVRQFALRKGSGGRGEFTGGDGVVRELEFTQPAQVSILSDRRVFSPYGMRGGEPGAPGMNLLVRTGGRVVNLGGKNSVTVHPGDRIRICTPGGGGWGTPVPNHGKTLSNGCNDIEEMST